MFVFRTHLAQTARMYGSDSITLVHLRANRFATCHARKCTNLYQAIDDRVTLSFQTSFSCILFTASEVSEVPVSRCFSIRWWRDWNVFHAVFNYLFYKVRARIDIGIDECYKHMCDKVQFVFRDYCYFPISIHFKFFNSNLGNLFLKILFFLIIKY